MTGQEMCVVISDAWYKFQGERVDPKEIWEMSPTGELWPVFALYNWAEKFLKEENASDLNR